MKRRVILYLLLFLLSSAAFADVLLSNPKIAGRESRYVEVGSSPKVTIKYRNHLGSYAALSFVEIHLRYKAVIDTVVGIKNENPENLQERGMDISTPGEIFYKLETSPTSLKPLKIAPGETVDLATITFHIDQGVAPGWVSLVFWSPMIPCRVKEGATDITGAQLPPVSISLQPSKPPSFSGLNLVESKDALGRPNVGTVLLDWRTAGTAARDMTPYHNSKLNYRVFRSTDFVTWDELTTPPTLSPDEDPETRALPYTGNIEGTDYVYEDREVTIGTPYYYKVTASDATSPTPNEIDTPIKGPVIPLDLTPPGEVRNLTTQADNNLVILRWENPTDPDLDGVVIVKNEGKEVEVTRSLGRAQTLPPYGLGPEYSIDEEPFGLNKGRIIYVSAPGENPTEFEDTMAVNGLVGYYRVFTFDRMRNYSNGVSIAKAAGIPPRPITNFTARPGTFPGEIILSWNNSPSDFQGGTLIRYTTDDRFRFAALRDEGAGEIAGVFPVTTGTEGLEEVSLGFLPGRNYYFKAFAYNQTAEELDPLRPESMALHLFSEGVTAAVSLPREETEEMLTYTYNFQTGINDFVVPILGEGWVITNGEGGAIDISTWEKLIDEINRQAGENATLTFGVWNADEQKAEGIVSIDYSKAGWDRFTCTSGRTPGEATLLGKAYQISVSKPFTFTLSARRLRL